LSSGIIRNPDYTMEQVVSVARTLREVHDFRGYIHLKTIPDASDELIAAAGRYADRLSINIELPTAQSLIKLAPEKSNIAIRRSMARLRTHIDENKEDARTIRGTPRFAPAGQSTQMIVGADATDDKTIIETSANLYGSYRLRRVYYSAFSPIPDASRALPLKPPPLIREHRLYQADWLMRFYNFTADEIITRPDGMLDLDVDPKLAWALQNRARFPVDLNRAPREDLLRVPGLGAKAVAKIIAARRVRAVCADDLARLRVPLKKVLNFIVVPGHRPVATTDSAWLAAQTPTPTAQLTLFDAPSAADVRVPLLTDD
ncbi:MAG: putative DNA modification/repair radical SAM protein, partial [Betaproteobacteria bacterium]